MSEPWEDFQDTKPWEDFGQVQTLNQTEGADPSRVWQGSLGKTLMEQGRRGMGWMQTPLINLPRFGPEYTQNPNAKPWQLFTEGAVNRVASDVEGMSTFPNMVLAPLTLGQGIIAQFLRPALVSLFGTKILGEQLPQAAGDASVKLIPSSSPVLPGAPESFTPSEKGESAAGVVDLSVLGALLAHSAKPIDSLRVPTEPKLLGSDINPNLTLRDINEIQGQIPPERQLTQFNPTMATRGPDVLGTRPGQVPIPLPEKSGDIIPLLRDPRRQLMAPGEGEQLQQQQMQNAVARMIQERQYSMEGRNVRQSPIRLPETSGEPSPTTLQLKGPPTFISGGEPSSTVSQKTLSPAELTEFQREALSNRLLEQRQPKGLQLKPTKEQASQKTQEGSINLSGPEEVLREFKAKLMNGTQIINRLRNKLHPDEWGMYKDVGIEAFANKQVDPKEVAKWMEDNGPKVEVRKFGEGGQTLEQKEWARMTHEWYDNREVMTDEQQNHVYEARRRYENGDYVVGDQIIKGLPENLRENATRYAKLSAKVNNEQGNLRATPSAHWSSIAPKAESEMPGYTEGAVVLPLDVHGSSSSPRPRFESSHSFPPNTLAFWRGYMETTKEGKKVFHVIEVQSDWAQRRREALQRAQDQPMSEGAQNAYGVQSHPLLRQYERLALKSAIEHAKSEGADAIAISDAETAMMTEGHDKEYRVGTGKESLKESDIKQAPGMRLHYDQTLPKIAEELTGKKGERVEFGDHKMAVGKRNEPGQRVGNDVYRKDLIFRNADSSPKTSVSARLYPLERVEKDFSTFGKDKLQTPDAIAKDVGLTFVGEQKPQVPGMQGLWEFRLKEPGKEMFSVTTKVGATAEEVKTAKERKLEEVQQAEPQKPRLQGLQLKPTAEQLKHKSQEGSINLEPLHESFDKASKFAKDSFTKILDSIYGNDIERSTSEAVGHLKAKWAGWALPHHVGVSEETANRAIEYASAGTTSEQYGKALATEVLGDRYKDKDFSNQLGKVVVEDRLRALEKEHRDKGQIELANKVTHVMADSEYRKAITDPEIKAALGRHKETVQVVAEKQHSALGGKLAPKGPEGTFVNLLNILHAEGEVGKGPIYEGNVTTKAVGKGSVFDKAAKGTAPGYELDYRKLAERMVEGNYKRNTLREWLNAGVKAGVYSYGGPGELPVVRGKPAVSMPVRVKATPWGSQTIKSLWVRADLAPEVSQILRGSGRLPKAGAQLLLDAATELQLVGPTDFVFHSANMYSSIVKSPGKVGNYAADLALRLPVVKQLHAIGSIGWDMYKVISDQPEIQKQLAEISRIGALRPEQGKPTLLAKATGGILDTGKLIRVMDRAGRLSRDRMFDNLVKQGLTENNELNRREFINGMGQYNEKLMSHFMSTMRNYTSQFVVAGRTFNRNAMQSLLGSNEVRASNPAAYGKMKMSNLISTYSTLVAIPLVLNYAMTGKPFGRPGTPIGKIDTGKDGEDGRPITIDPAKTDLLRRGMRISGVEAIAEGIRQGKPMGENLANAAKDVIMGQLHPWMGPPIRVAEGFTSKYAETHNAGEALLAAVKAINPAVTAYFTKDEKGEKGGVKEVTKQLGTSIGVGQGRFLTHNEQVEKFVGKPIPEMTLQERRNAEKQIKVNERPRTREDEAKGAATAIKQNAKRGGELQDGLKEEVKTWLNGKGLKVPNYDDTVSYGKRKLVLTIEEQTRFKELLTEEYDRFLMPWVGKNVKQEQVSQRLEQATARARHRLLKEMKRQLA